MNIRTERFFNRGGGRLFCKVTLFFLLCTFSSHAFARISKSKFNLLMTQVELLQAEVESNQEKLEAQTKKIEELTAALKELEAGDEGRDAEIAKMRKVIIASKKRLIHLYKTRKKLNERLTKQTEAHSMNTCPSSQTCVHAANTATTPLTSTATPATRPRAIINEQG